LSLIVHLTLQNSNSQRNMNSDLAHVLEVNEFKSFYRPATDDDNFYHVTCKMILQDYSQTCDDDYDFEFFYQNYHVKCKFLPHHLVASILNKEIYGIDFDTNDLKHKYSLTTLQKSNLDLDLKQILFPRDQILIYSRYSSDSRNSETSMSQRNKSMNASTNQVSTQTVEIQPIQTYQNEFKLFYIRLLMMIIFIT
jgi:hypothetical protein